MYEQNTSMMNIPEQNAFLLPAMVEGDFSSEEIAEDADGLQMMSFQRVKIPAGWMIDRCGWKGKALGPAAVHDKQALVLVNLGGATGKDVVALSDAVRASVKEKFGVEIHPEVNFIE